MTGCWLAANAVHERGPMPPCDGRLREVHLIPKALLKREGLGKYAHDPRGFVMACGGPMGNGGHHGMLDCSRTLRIPRDRIPDHVECMAVELGLLWWLSREYGERSPGPVDSCEACGTSWPVDPRGAQNCPSCEVGAI